MNSANRKIEADGLEDREVEGLFCEEVLRSWLQNLESLVQQRDVGTCDSGAEVDQPRAGKHSALKVVQ